MNSPVPASSETDSPPSTTSVSLVSPESELAISVTARLKVERTSVTPS